MVQGRSRDRRAPLRQDSRVLSPDGGEGWGPLCRRVVCARPCASRRHGPNRVREVGEGRTARQPGQVRKEAALTSQGGSLSNLPLTRLGRRRPGERNRKFAFASERRFIERSKA